MIAVLTILGREALDHIPMMKQRAFGESAEGGSSEA